ncbi:MAG TPA: histidine kinase, partial [Candidatus Methylomirabilis sp.]|nr:histidine kinase [Candidatus Methylomirabilis sp.]
MGTDLTLAQMVETLKTEVAKRTAAEETLRQQSAQLRALASELILAEQRERRRVAEVLHGDLQQLLVGARLLIERLEQAGDLDVQETAREATELLRRALESSRSLAEELRPPYLRQGALLPALEWLARWMAEKYRFTVVLRADGTDLTGNPDTATLLFESI